MTSDSCHRQGRLDGGVDQLEQPAPETLELVPVDPDETLPLTGRIVDTENEISSALDLSVREREAIDDGRRVFFAAIDPPPERKSRVGALVADQMFDRGHASALL